MARTQLQNLAWLATKARLEMGMEAVDVQATAIAARPSEIKQAVPLTVKLWLVLERAAESPNFVVAGLAVIWIVKIESSLRFAHIQRSFLVKVTDTALIFWCGLNKTKRGGIRRPFYVGYSETGSYYKGRCA